MTQTVAAKHTRTVPIALEKLSPTVKIEEMKLFERALKPNTSKDPSVDFDPFRGTGFSGDRNHFTPDGEVVGNSLALEHGAEMWEYDTSGMQRIVASFDKPSGTWNKW